MEQKITKEIMERYEQIRSLGPCNMFDFYCIQRIANEMEFYDLANLTKQEYIYILSNFSQLMKKYGISQD